MAKVTIAAEICKGCSLCVNTCPKKILKISEKLNLKGYPVVECIDMDECSGCASCAKMCPDCVLQIER